MFALNPLQCAIVAMMPLKFKLLFSLLTAGVPISSSPTNHGTCSQSLTHDDIFREPAVPARSSPLSPRQRGLVCRSDTFDGILPKDALIESIDRVSNGSSYGEGPSNIAYPTNPTNLPELCAVTVKVTTSPTSAYRFGLLMPTQWNYRFLAVGNGGFSGGINWLDTGAGARMGFATMSTDTGHNSTSGDLRWALNEEERRKDFGHRAMHGSVVLSKLLIHAYYSDGPSRSYYSGCSTGGRQGLKEVQLHADSFDGLLIGAPAWWSTGLAVWTTMIGVNNLPAGAPNHIPPNLVAALGREVMRQCDKVDGLEDGIISSPEACSFNFDGIRCGTSGVSATTCLTNEQIKTAQRAYADYSINGKFAFSGLSLGSEDLWGVLMGQPTPDARGQEYIKMFVLNDPNWHWSAFNDSIMALAADMDPGDLTADNFDLSQFRDRKGKIIMYHGDADGLIPTRSSDYYYNKTIEAMGGLSGLRSWFRYFHVPGLGHCSGTRVNAPWYFGAGNQAGSLGSGTNSVPGLADAKHDALLALLDWVEKGAVVDSIVATTWKVPTNATSGVLRQRPICAFPEKATIINRDGDEKSVDNWKCV